MLFIGVFAAINILDGQEEIVEEVSTESYLEKEISRLHSSFEGAVLFLGGQETRIGPASPNNASLGVFGGPNEEGESSDLQTVGGSALLSSTPVLSIIPSGSILSKEALTFTYVVEEGDALSVIAEDFGISLSTLLWANNMGSGTILRTGDRLTILPVSGVTHIVSRGDTIGLIAAKYKADEDDILAHNRLSDDDIIKIGDVLVIPGGSPHVQISARISPQTSIYSLARLDGYFALPARGRVTYGLHRYNAVDIGGKDYCNTPIYAAAAGNIITADGAGWNGGYGKYLKINHPNGTVTLYAHNSQLLVLQGQYVSKGQVVALMGSTGNTTGCHVHFEVRGAQNPFAG